MEASSKRSQSGALKSQCGADVCACVGCEAAVGPWSSEQLTPTLQISVGLEAIGFVVYNSAWRESERECVCVRVRVRVRVGAVIQGARAFGYEKNKLLHLRNTHPRPSGISTSFLSGFVTGSCSRMSGTAIRPVFRREGLLEDCRLDSNARLCKTYGGTNELLVESLSSQLGRVG